MYKNKYFLAFYDKSGEEFIDCFDSIKDIAKYLKIDVTNKNKMNNLYANIYYAIKENMTTKILGKPMKIYLIDIEEN